MDQEHDGSADRAEIVVPQVGRLVATSEAWTPFRLLDAEGVEVEGCSTFFGELRACGRSVSTVRSYGMDLLRWFRCLWALQIAWDRATRAEARDFSRWLQVAGKPVRRHWRDKSQVDVSESNDVVGKPYSVSVLAHS